MRFDMQDPTADVRHYARVLRDAVHGPEIRRVLVRVVPWAEVARGCGAVDSSGCYRIASPRRGVITVPPGDEDEIRHVLLHEYGHHVDAFRGGTRAAPEPNGTWRWWVARRMTERVRAGQAAMGYSLGWTRAVGEVFAEDYVQLNVRAPYTIPWLRPPGPRIRSAINEDITGVPGVPPRAEAPGGASPSPAAGRRIVRRGVLREGETRAVVFELRSARRRIEAVIDLRGVDGPATARAGLRCAGAPPAVGEDGADDLVVLRLAAAGPGQCELVVANGDQPAVYTVTITVEPPLRRLARAGNRQVLAGS